MAVIRLESSSEIDVAFFVGTLLSVRPVRVCSVFSISFPPVIKSVFHSENITYNRNLY